MPRRTLLTTAELAGTGLHTGVAVTVRLAPAPSGTGICFRRSDHAGSGALPARVDTVIGTDRCTAIGRDGVEVSTVEHLMAALHATELDDVLVTIDGPEIPMADGSFLPWVEAIEQAGTVEHDGDPAVITVRTPFTVSAGGGEYFVAPAAGLVVTTTIDWDHPLIGNQSLSLELSTAGFRRELAAARTFGFVDEIAALRERGLLQGATDTMAVVLSADGVVNGKLRWPDEFVRHKAGDLIGDLALLGARINAHIVARRPSHQGNLALATALSRQAHRADPAMLDITRLMAVLPHRYPFLLVDRIIEIEPERRIVGLKNVTINEPFFQGHFPGHPIMPGVLIIEAMAQAGGMLVMDHIDDPAEKVVYFMAIDGVKFRRPVRPGDQLRFEITMVQFRGRTCRMRGETYVDGQLACEAEFMARVVDR